jgi:hypothetical protein
MDLPWVDYILNLSKTIKRATDKVTVGSQITLIADNSNTITPYTGVSADERIYYTHPNIRAKVQIISSKYNDGSVPTRIKIGTGSYGDYVGGVVPPDFFLRQDQLVGGLPPTEWESRWGLGGSINDIDNPIFEMEIGAYERTSIGTYGFTHAMVASALFKDELLSNVSIDLNKYPAYYTMEITNPCTVNGDITVTLGLNVTTVSLNTTDHDTVEKIGQTLRSLSYPEWEVTGEDEVIRFFPNITDTYADPATVLGVGSTGVTGLVTGAPVVLPTVIQLPHSYIAPGSVKLRIVFPAGAFSTSSIPDDVSHEIIIKEIRQNNTWETATYVTSSYHTYTNNNAETIVDYYNGYRDITDNDSVYLDTSAIDENGDFLTPYIRTQETVALNLQNISLGEDVTIDHATGAVTLAPQFIRNAFQLSRDHTYECVDSVVDRTLSIDTNVYCTYNLRADQTLRNTAIVGITEVGLFNGDDNMIAYATFPPIIYDSIKHHASFNFFLTSTFLSPISI